MIVKRRRFLLRVVVILSIFFSLISSQAFAQPTTGMVRFVADLAGNGDVDEINARETIYIRVDDADQDLNASSLDILTVTLTTPGGDDETLILFETGSNTGVFTESIPSLNTSVIVGDGTIQVSPPQEIVTVTYIDAIDADNNFNQPRTDTLSVLSPNISVCKIVDPNSTAPGGTVTYTITIKNSGYVDGLLTSILDSLPNDFSYINNSTTGITNNDPLIVGGRTLIWSESGAWIVPRQVGGVDGKLTLSFQATARKSIGTFYNDVQVSGDNFETTPMTCPSYMAAVTVRAPLIRLTKEVNKSEGAPGEELVYSVHYWNLGNGPAHNLVIKDTVPSNTTYIPDSLRLGSANSTYATATPKTDALGDDEGEVSGNTIIFTIDLVFPNNGIINSGTDEGKIYFKVQID